VRCCLKAVAAWGVLRALWDPIVGDVPVLMSRTRQCWGVTGVRLLRCDSFSWCLRWRGVWCLVSSVWCDFQSPGMWWSWSGVVEGKASKLKRSFRCQNVCLDLDDGVRV
jgi:hypothetical protein